MTKIEAFLVVGLLVGLGGCQPDKSSDEHTHTKTTTNTEPSALEQNQTSIVDRIQPIVDQSSRGQYVAIKSFPGPDGLVGLLLKSKTGGNKIIAWTSPSGQVLMAGPLFDLKGDNLTETLLAEQAGFLTVEKLADAVLDPEGLNQGFVAGSTGPVITVFFEPYCQYCAKLLKDLSPRIKSGKIRVRFVLVGFLNPDSVETAARISASPDPYAALLDWETSRDKKNLQHIDITLAQKSKIQLANDLLNKVGPVGTPSILLCRSDQRLDFVRGMPADVGKFLKEASDKGHPICEQSPSNLPTIAPKTPGQT